MGEFLNTYFKLGISVESARNPHTCASALMSRNIDVMSKDMIAFLRGAESKRVDLETKERKKKAVTFEKRVKEIYPRDMEYCQRMDRDSGLEEQFISWI